MSGYGSESSRRGRKIKSESPGKSLSRSPSRSVSPRRGRGRSHSPSPPPRKGRSYSHSRSRTPPRRRHWKSRSRSVSRSPVRSRHGNRRHYRSYSRSRSHSRSRSYSRSRSRSRSPSGRRGGWNRRDRSHSPMSNRRRHDGNRYNPDPSQVLGIFGLSLYTGEKDLREMLAKYGRITEVQVVYDHQTGRSRGFAFVYFDDVEDAIDAKEHLNGVELDGRKIRVDYSITGRPHTPTPGVYMGRPTRPPKEERRHDDHDRGGGGGGGGSRYGRSYDY